MFDYKQDVEVNESDLDGEWIRQAGLYAHWAVQYARELAIKDRIWLRKKILKAQLYGNYRIQLTVQDKAPTDTRVDAAVHADPAYEKISLELIDAEERVNILDAIKWSMEQKKKSLDRLSENRDKTLGMPDRYRSKEAKLEAARERQREESEDIDKAARASMATKTKIKR